MGKVLNRVFSPITAWDEINGKPKLTKQKSQIRLGRKQRTNGNLGVEQGRKLERMVGKGKGIA